MNASTSLFPLTVITHEFHPAKGGIATFVEEISRACHELGHDVEVWAPETRNGAEQPFPFPVVRVPLKGSQDLSCQLRMARRIVANRRSLRQRVVYLPEPGPVLAMTYLQFFKAFKPARLVLTFHGSEIQKFASRPVARYMVGRLIKAADRVTTPSKFSLDLLCERFPEARPRAIVTPGALRANFGLGSTSREKTSDKVVVLTVGRLHPRKGQLHILDALSGLPDQLIKKVEYWVVGRCGRGDYEARLRRRAAESRVPVTFLGNINDDDLEFLYRRADIFAMTSVNHGNSVEGFGLAYLEASAFGLPVIGHAVGGVSEAVQNGETGLLVRPGDTRGLRSAFERLITDISLRERLGAAGRTWARKHTWQDSARLLMNGFVRHAVRTPVLQTQLQTA